MRSRVLEAIILACCLALLASCSAATSTPGDPADPVKPIPVDVGPSSPGPGTERSNPRATPADTDATLAGIGKLLAMPASPAPEALKPEALANAIEACCRTGPENCKLCLDQVVESKRAADELWPTLGRFLGPLRDQAELGIEGLGSTVLSDSAGQNRDRLFRMAVASARTRRGEADKQGYRATTLPLVPTAGEPTWLLVEFPAPCPECQGTLEGPDKEGRMHLELSFDCPGANLDASFEVMPAASRAVWTQRLETMPGNGITLFVNGNEEPVLTAGPGKPSVLEPTNSGASPFGGPG